VGWNEPFVMAVINAPIPGCAGVAKGVELAVLAALTAGVTVTRPASGFTGATSVTAGAVAAVLLAGFAGGGPHVTQPASGFTVTVVVFVVLGAAGVLTATPPPELATGSRDVTRAAKGFTALVVCPEVVDPVCALWVCAGTRAGVVRVTEC
jgi:hypothetical protein